MFIELGMFIGLVTFLSLLLPIILLHPNFVSNDLHSEYFRLGAIRSLSQLLNSAIVAQKHHPSTGSLYRMGRAGFQENFISKNKPGLDLDTGFAPFLCYPSPSIQFGKRPYSCVWQ